MNKIKSVVFPILLLILVSTLSSQTGTLNICSGTDDNVFPVNIYTTATTSTPVVFQLQCSEPLLGSKQSQMFIQWEKFKILDNGDEKPLDQFVMQTQSGFLRYATEDMYYFKEPGKYAVYAIDYYKRDFLEHSGYKEYFGRTFIEITN